MITDRIQVLQHDIDVEFSVPIPKKYKPNFMYDLKIDIKGAIQNDDIIGISKRFYEEEVSVTTYNLGLK